MTALAVETNPVKQASAIPDSLRDMVASCMASVYADGVTPMEAAQEFCSLRGLSRPDILVAVQIAVSSLVRREMTQSGRVPQKDPARQDLGSGGESPPPLGVIMAMAKEVGRNLRKFYEGADGVEKPLLEFTLSDHEYRRGIERSIMSGATKRERFHAEAIAALKRANVDTIANLPDADRDRLSEILT